VLTWLGLALVFRAARMRREATRARVRGDEPGSPPAAP